MIISSVCCFPLDHCRTGHVACRIQRWAPRVLHPTHEERGRDLASSVTGLAAASMQLLCLNFGRALASAVQYVMLPFGRSVMQRLQGGPLPYGFAKRPADVQTVKSADVIEL